MRRQKAPNPASRRDDVQGRARSTARGRRLRVVTVGRSSGAEGGLDDDYRDDDRFDAAHISAHLLGRCGADFDEFWGQLSRPPQRLMQLVRRWSTAAGQ